ncbi:MAG: ABC transporter ATP-binding protein [Anaerolineales bacterium]|nr:ABC transporter ATP-binding protein [Anaerolineales bacterium]
MSNSPVIRFEHLSKTYGGRKRQVRALRDLNLAIEAGQVFGFLGPNGAGKTTTIRLLLGLIHPTEGSAYLFGQDVHQNPDIVRRVGSLVEGAAFYGFLTGRQNLEVLDRTADEHNPVRIDQLLEQVGLADKAEQRVKGYSTGMKQRLGLAAALLRDPDVVILDEPTNGLDPAGIQEMRSFIRELVDDHGKTVFLSSHLLNEVEQVCDRVAIIQNGRMIKHGAVTELLADGQAELRIQAQPVEQAFDVLAENWPVVRDNGWLVVQTHAEESPAIVSRLVENQVRVYQVLTQRQSLESLFMEVTRNNGDLKEDAPEEAPHA